MSTTEPLSVTTEDLARPEWAGISPTYTVNDAAGFWYAFGRMDQGHAPVVIQPSHGSSPSQSTTAWHFGRLWAAEQYRFSTEGGSSSGMETSWENYVASGGRTLHRVRTAG